MPTYDFKCPQCEEVVKDVIVSNFNDATNTNRPHCPFCEKDRHDCILMIKQPAAPSFVIKGFNAGNGYGK